MAGIELTDKQRRLDAELKKGVTPEIAASLAGYTGGGASAALKSLKSNPIRLAAIHKELQTRLVDGASVMLDVIESIAKSPDVLDRVKLDAAKSWLDRAGIVAARIAPDSVGQKPLNEQTTQELRDLADKLQTEIEARARDVSPADPGDNAPPVDAIESKPDDLLA